MSMERIPAREVTLESVYISRRKFMKFAGAAASLAVTGLTYRRFNRTGGMAVTTEELTGVRSVTPEGAAKGFTLDEARTPLNRVVNYNNFYEFTTDKEGVAEAAMGFVAKPWQVSVGGIVHQPRVFDLDDLLKLRTTGGAHLPASLRRGVVDGGAMGRLSARRSLMDAVIPMSQCEIRRTLTR